MPEDETVLVSAWRRATRRRRWYAVAAVLVLAAIAASVGLLTQRSGERPLSQRARAVEAMQRALVQENLGIQARLRALAAANRARAAADRAHAVANH